MIINPKMEMVYNVGYNRITEKDHFSKKCQYDKVNYTKLI